MARPTASVLTAIAAALSGGGGAAVESPQTAAQESSSGTVWARGYVYGGHGEVNQRQARKRFRQATRKARRRYWSKG